MITNSLQSDPAIAIDPIMFEAGFKAGRRSMLRGSLADNSSYMMGFRTGLMFYRSSIPGGIQESYLEIGAHDEPLNPLDNSRPPMI